MCLYNSDYVIEEECLYTIHNSSIELEHQTKALKDIEIFKYYGLQTQYNLWNQSVIYHYSDNSSDEFSLKSSSFSKAKSEKKVDSYTYLSSEHSLTMDVFIDRNGLGDLSYLADNQSTCFTMDYGKSYYNLINGISCVLEKGDIIKWSGAMYLTNE